MISRGVNFEKIDFARIDLGVDLARVELIS